MILLTSILTFALIFFISAIPLYFAVKLVGGKTTFFKSAMINLLVGFLVGLISNFFPLFGVLLGFIALLLFYKYFFRISFFKALLIWILEIVIIGIFWIIAVLLGVSFLAALLVL